MEDIPEYKIGLTPKPRADLQLIVYYNDTDDKRFDLLTHLVQDVTNVKPEVSFDPIRHLVVDFDNKQDLMMSMNCLQGHRMKPYEKFEAIKEDDFSVIMMGEDIDADMLQNLFKMEMAVMNNKINLLQHLIVNEVQDQIDLETRLKAIEAFMEKGCLSTYPAFANYMIEKLDENGIVNKATFNQDIFPTIH